MRISPTKYSLYSRNAVVCYDVGKDGVKVAVLTFPKSSYRLGETVFGVVELNDRTGRSRVLKVRSSDHVAASSLLTK